MKRSNQKLLAALILSIAAIFPMTASASNEVTVGAGTSEEDLATGTNDGSIVAEEEFDYIKHELGDNNLNRSVYGMAAVVQDTGTNAQTGYLEAANYAYLVNNGSIVLNYHDIVAAYADQLDTSSDTSKKYDNIMGWGMLAGQYSTLINNGTISFYYDEDDPTATYGLFSHPMYTYSHSKMINNGQINITGSGGTGAQVRGITTQHSYVDITNNGSIYIDVTYAALCRALATTGIGSNIINNGTVYNRSGGATYGMSQNAGGSLVNNGTLTIIGTTEASSGTAAGILPSVESGAYGMVSTGGDQGLGVGITNNGVINVSIEGDNPKSTMTAAGFVLTNFQSGANASNSGTWYLANNGVINRYSTVTASSDNNYIVRTPEIGINLLTFGGAFNPVNAQIGNWATTLRDFGTTKDFIQVKRHSADTNREYPVTINFANTNLILRPESGYTAGTSYLISYDTLITSVDNDSTEYNASGIDSMTYSAEMSDFISTNVVDNGDSTYNVSLIPVDNESLNKKVISATAMLPIDFTRGVMDQIDREIERRDRKANKWFVSPYYSKFDRSDGIDGHAHGFLAGADWKLGRKFFGGFQAAYSLGSGDGDIYSAEGNVKNLAGGIHFMLYPEEGKNWIRGQFSYFHNSGDTNLTMTTDTSTLNGKFSNGSDGFYISTSGGFRSKFTDKDFLRSEVGLSYLNFVDSPELNWNLLGSQIDGYTMKMDKYNALYATLKETYVHNFSEKDSLAFGLGVRGRLSAEKLNLNMMNFDYSGDVREDSCQGLVDLSYIHQIKDFAIDLGYQGVFGSDLKNNLFHASLKMSF